MYQSNNQIREVSFTMDNKNEISVLVSAFLLEIDSGNLSGSMRDAYHRVSSNILNVADEMGVTEYSDEFASRCKAALAKEIPQCYRTTINRILRIIGELATEGTADYAADYSQRGKYLVSERIQKLVEKILNHHAVDGRERKNLDTIIRHFFVYSEEKGLTTDGLSDQTLMDFISEELPKTNRCSMDRAMAAIRCMSAYFKSVGKDGFSRDFGQLKVKGGSTRAVPPYSKDEICRILDVIDTGCVLGKRDYAIILLSYETGLRSVDIRSLRLSDIDWKRGTISICQSKTSVPLIVHINGRVMNAIADYILNARPECGCKEVFLSTRGDIRPLTTGAALTNQFDRYCKKADVRKVRSRSFHSLRRSFAVKMSESDVPIEMISEMLGHTSIDSDKPYLTYNRDQIAFCSIGFQEVPIKSGVYASGKEALYGSTK